MTRSFVAGSLALALLPLAMPQPLHAQQQARNPVIRERLVPQVTARRLFEEQKKPYASLFPSEPLRSSQAPRPAATAGKDLKTRVVCGMTVVPVTPALDPKMTVAVPHDPNVTHAMRVIKPTLCVDKK